MSEQDPRQQNQNGRIVLIVLGVVLIMVGLSNLGEWGLDRWPTAFRPFGGLLGWAGDWAFPVLVIVGGILLIVFSSKGEGHFRVPTKSDRLYRSRSQRMVAGVLGGLAEYFSVDPTLLRLGVVAFALITEFWPVLVTYIAAAIIVPEAPEVLQPSAVSAPPPAAPAVPPPATPPASPVEHASATEESQQ